VITNDVSDYIICNNPLFLVHIDPLQSPRWRIRETQI